ncbi:kelch motif family protein [Stylonychia lemnae]|uniref:Kelch motif family protein n=1 Tax=Stylonychia lemnae TaxID=5949 RepID=A0A078AII8_STYLE|nr:kelch motif family protein [Stylonychia lemnae]|eukprot:CDW82034.1 kelch motif family protein [Stylonychia lemnae]
MKHQLKLIDRFQEDMHIAQFETETEYLSKIKKRYDKKEKALQEIQNLEFQKVFNDFHDKEELKKISSLITSKNFLKLSNNSIIHQTSVAPTTSAHHNLSISNTKTQQHTCRKQQRQGIHNLFANGSTKVNRINLLSNNNGIQQSSIQQQISSNQVNCPVISVAQIRSRSKDKSDTLFKSSIMAKKQNLTAGSPSPFGNQPGGVNNSNHFQMSRSNHFQSLEFSPQQENLNDLEKLNEQMYQKTISMNEKFQQQTFSDNSTDREYYMSHPKNLLQSQDGSQNNLQCTNQNINVEMNDSIVNTNSNNQHSIQMPNQSLGNQINIYSSINNTASSSAYSHSNQNQHQMFSKHYTNYQKRSSKLTTSNNDSGKKSSNTRLISTTINLKDITEQSQKTVNQVARALLDQKKLNSSTKKQYNQSSIKKKLKQRTDTQDYTRQPTRQAEIRLQDENLKNPNILSNQFYIAPDENQNRIENDEDEEIDQVFDEDEFNENKIKNYKIGLQRCNQSQIEYSLAKNKREPLFDIKPQPNRHHDGVDKQRPYNDRKNTKVQNQIIKSSSNAQRALIIKTQTEIKNQDLGYFENNPTPKQLDFDKWQKCKGLKSPLDRSNDNSEMITDSMIQNNNFQRKSNNRNDQMDLLNQLYQKTESYLYVFSGFYDHPLNSIEKYDANKGTWTEIIGALNIPRTKFQCVPVQQNDETLIYILGGKKFDGNRTNSIEVFNPKTGDVKSISLSLQKPRSGFASVCIQNQLLLIGGNDGKVLNKVDALDLQTHQWAKLPNMLKARDELAVAMGPDLKIYAVGGYDGPDNNCLNTAERFDPQTGRWEQLPSMNECRRALSLVALPDGIYAIGGYNGNRYLSSVEKYLIIHLLNAIYRFDEQRNQWILMNSMNNERCTISAIPSPDYQYIYVLGGFNGKPMNVVERYSVLNDVWEFVTPMKRARFMHSSCFVSFNSSINAKSINNMLFDSEDF